jgi:hypothetical protein
MNLFDGLYGYEKLMLVCGFVLFVFALAAITVLIVKNRDFKAAMGLFVFAILLMGFPGIQAVKFKDGLVELDNLRQQPPGSVDPQQQQQAQALLRDLEQRAADKPLLQAKVSDGYRVIGNVDKAYQLAKPLLRDQSAQVQATLVPVLTAKLNQVQASVAGAAAPGRAGEHKSPGGNAAAPPSTQVAPATTPDKQRELAIIASQLQATGTPLPAASHVALAKAYATLDRPQQVRANVDAARRLDPSIHINPALLHATGNGYQPTGH